jgi:hypothetical protein
MELDENKRDADSPTLKVENQSNPSKTIFLAKYSFMFTGEPIEFIEMGEVSRGIEGTHDLSIANTRKARFVA